MEHMRTRESASEKKRAQLMEEMEEIEAYLRDRGVEYELRKDEVPFAVLWPTPSADARSLLALGEHLREWMVCNPEVKRILGLERLLEGRCPEVSGLLLGIPIYFCPTKPEAFVESVALVVVDDDGNTEGLVSSLCDLVECSGVAMVASWEQYSHMNR